MVRHHRLACRDRAPLDAQPVPRRAADQQRAGRLRRRHRDQRAAQPGGPFRSPPPVLRLRVGRGPRQSRDTRLRADIARRSLAALPHRLLHGRRLSGRHEARGDLGARRSRPADRPARCRADVRLGTATSGRRRRRPRLAGAGARRRAQRARRRRRDPLRARRSRAHDGAEAAAGECARRLAQSARAPRQSRLSRPHVGALRHVGMVRQLHGRQPAAALRQCPALPRAARHLRGRGLGRHRRARRRLARRPARPHAGDDGLYADQRHLRAVASACCSADRSGR